MVPQAYGKYYIFLIGMYKRSNAFRAPDRRGRGPSPGAQAGRPYQLRWCSGGSQVAVPSEPLGQQGWGPSPGALALTMLTLSSEKNLIFLSFLQSIFLFPVFLCSFIIHITADSVILNKSIFNVLLFLIVNLHHMFLRLSY